MSDSDSNSGLESDLKQSLKLSQRKLHAIQDISAAMGTILNRDDLLLLIMRKITELMHAERSTLFLIDTQTNELWSKIAQSVGTLEIRLEMGQGIAGWVAETGNTINIEDAYSDDRFHQEVDKQTGYRTKSILCVAMKNLRGNICGVIQVLNKTEGVFNAEDEEYLKALATQAAIAIENSNLYGSLLNQNKELAQAQSSLKQSYHELDVLFSLERRVSRARNLEHLYESLLDLAIEVAQAQGGMMVEIQAKQSHLNCVSQMGVTNLDVNTKIFPEQSSFGAVIESGEAQSNQVTAHTAAFEREHWPDQQYYLTVPIKGHHDTLGALQISRPSPSFTDRDTQLLMMLASQAARSIFVWQEQAVRERAERLTSIGRMMSTVLHDLKTPMTVISGYVQMMVDQADSKKRKEMSKTVHNQFLEMSAMTGDVISFASGKTQLLLGTIFTHEFMQSIESSIEELIRNLDITIDVQCELKYSGKARVDGPKLMRVIQNLCRNAIEALTEQAPSGILNPIKNQTTEQKPFLDKTPLQLSTLRITIDRESDTLLLSVSDNGPGIPNAIEGHLFDEFVTTGKEHGTGLGLAIVKKIIEDHCGEISFTTSPQKGTQFNISVPGVIK